MTTKSEFEAFVAKHAHSASNPRKERDGEFLYECWDDDDGNEVAFITWRNGVADYTIKTEEIKARELLAAALAEDAATIDGGRFDREGWSNFFLEDWQNGHADAIELAWGLYNEHYAAK